MILAAYTITSDEQQVKSLFDGVIIQSKDEETWIPLVNTTSTTFDEMENEIIYKAGCKEQTINRNDILRAQMKDPTIRGMTELKHKNIDQLSNEEKRKELAEVKTLQNIGINAMLIRMACYEEQYKIVIKSK